MHLHKRMLNSLFSRVLLATTLLGGFLLFAGMPSAKANDWDDCNRRAAYADWHYHEAIVQFGFYSPEAVYWHHERHEAFEQLERYRRYAWRERAWRDHEWREHEWREHEYREHHRHHRDWDGDGDRD